MFDAYNIPTSDNSLTFSNWGWFFHTSSQILMNTQMKVCLTSYEYEIIYIESALN